MSQTDDKLVQQRLTALWALSESGLGGILHAVQSPFTGIAVGGVAVLIIVLFGLLTAKPSRSILSALVVVLIIKAAISPHSSPTAYFAVAFQGLLGAALFARPGIQSAKVYFLSVVAMLESALQKLIILTILVGHSLWDAIDLYGRQISKWLGISLTFSPSLGAVILYLLIYLIGGIYIGFLAQRLGQIVKRELDNKEYQIILTPSDIMATQGMHLRSWFSLKRLWWLIAILLVSIGLVLWGEDQSSYADVGQIILRVSIILSVWFWVIAPLIRHLLSTLLQRQRSTMEGEVASTLSMLPYLQIIAKKAWQQSSARRGHHRISHFLALVILYSLHFSVNPT